MPHPVVLLLPPPPEEGHLDVDEPLGRIAHQDRDHRIQDVLNTDVCDPLESEKQSKSLLFIQKTFIINSSTETLETSLDHE